jgi:hypothetical protein
MILKSFPMSVGFNHLNFLSNFCVLLLVTEVTISPWRGKGKRYLDSFNVRHEQTTSSAHIHEGISAFGPWTFTWTPGASTQLAICSKLPCSIAISSWPCLQDAISSSPPLQLSREVVRTRSEHSSQSAHTLHYVKTHPGTIAERNLISAKLARLCGDSRPHWVQTEKAEIPSGWDWEVSSIFEWIWRFV